VAAQIYTTISLGSHIQTLAEVSLLQENGIFARRGGFPTNTFTPPDIIQYDDRKKII
jgi:hypothetical protein